MVGGTHPGTRRSKGKEILTTDGELEAKGLYEGTIIGSFSGIKGSVEEKSLMGWCRPIVHQRQIWITKNLQIPF
jgi:hypothetical protein